jgi:hypothetical protein
MENIEKQDKWEKLKKYLQDLEWYQLEIRELFLCKDINEQEYNKMINDSQESYKQFLKDLKGATTPK